MKAFRQVAVLAAAAVIALACGGSGGGTSSGGSSSSCSKTYKVGLVTDVGKLSDKSFNYDSWQGVLNAQKDSSLCVQARAIESSTQEDYPKNIAQFVDQKYDMVVTVGFKLGDATIAAAKANPTVKFAMVDYADFTDKPPPSNLVGLVFQEDQPGFLAGALAGLQTKSNTIAYVAGLESVPAVVKYVKGYTNGAKMTNPNVKVLGIYQPESGPKDFNDPDWGLQQANTFFGQGADIIFGVGGNTGNGALLAAKQKSKTCIGVDVDQFVSYPDVASCLMTSAEKHLDIAVKQSITNMVKKSWQSGTLTFDAKNNGVGIAPYHDYDSKVSTDVKAKVSDIATKLKEGSLATGVSTP
ncbi:MAG: BMP family ABC transporter substrate-binding protein [Candidatus Dormibacteraeota bacterium]|jgi:basic membrane protein A|nr:BMP family ABC transporter substrate-binding protein [Candidatus Dormibacteraeota bacterium]